MSINWKKITKILNMSLKDEETQLFAIPYNDTIIEINLQLFSLDYNKNE